MNRSSKGAAKIGKKLICLCIEMLGATSHRALWGGECDTSYEIIKLLNY